MLNYQLIERYCFLLLSLEIMSIGIIFINNSDLGIFPLLSLPYILSLYFKSSIIYFNLLLQLLFIIIQIVILNNNFKMFQFFQLIIWLILDLFLEINNIIFLRDFYPKHYLIKILFLLIGTFMIGMSINIQIIIKTLYTPSEGLLFTIYNYLNYNLCYTKIVIDFILILLSMIISYLIFGTILGIKESSIIAGIFVGYFIGISNKVVRKIILDFLYRNCPERKGEEKYNDNLFLEDDIYNKKEDFVNNLHIWD